jgi:hypothetical protein
VSITRRGFIGLLGASAALPLVVRYLPEPAGVISGNAGIDDYYTGHIVLIVEGKGLGQASVITSYDGRTRNARVMPFADPPDDSSTFMLIGPGTPEVAPTAMRFTNS